jgi:ankyrin repeat protein
MGFDLLEPDSDGICQYTRAIREGNYNAVNYVLNEGRRKGDGRGVRAIFDGIPLTVAAAVGTLNIAKLLVRNGANVFSESHIDNDEIISTSGLYSRFKKIPRPQYTIKLNSNHLSTLDLNSEELSMSPTPLYAAAANGHEEMVKWLLSEGAFPDLASPTGRIACPAAVGKVPSSEYITRYQAYFSGYPDPCGVPVHPIESKVDVAYYQRPLAGAVLNGHTEIVNILLRAKVDVNLEDSNGLSAVYLAAAMGFSEITQLLLDAGAVFDKDDKWAANQLLACASDGERTQTLKLFLQMGVSPNTRGLDKKTALIQATSNGSLECMKILLRAGADIHLRDSENRTPLGVACEQGSVHAASILLEAGADPNADKLHRKYLLFRACCRGSFEIAQLLLQNSAEVDSSC